MASDYLSLIRLLKTARGQMDAIVSMAEDDRSYDDVYTQLISVEKLLAKARYTVLKSQMRECIDDALTHGNVDEQLENMMRLLDKIER
jgi:DNA-binding FrmR family transcriptional regulator